MQTYNLHTYRVRTTNISNPSDKFNMCNKPLDNNPAKWQHNFSWNILIYIWPWYILKLLLHIYDRNSITVKVQ